MLASPPPPDPSRIQEWIQWGVGGYLRAVSSNEIDQAIVVQLQHVNGYGDVELGGVLFDELEDAPERAEGQSGLLVVADDRVRFPASSLAVSADAHVVAVEGGLDQSLPTQHAKFIIISSINSDPTNNPSVANMQTMANKRAQNGFMVQKLSYYKIH